MRPAGRPRPILLCLTFALSGCADSVAFDGAPRLALDPEPGALRFEDTLLEAEPAPHVVTLSNLGSAPLRLRAVRVREGGDAPSVRLSRAPAELAPGDEYRLQVRLRPARVGDLEATVVIETSDPSRPRVEYDVHARVQDRCELLLDPAQLRFEEVQDLRRARLVNRSQSACRITRMLLDRALFALVDPPDVPFELPAGASLELAVQQIEGAVSVGAPIRQLRVLAVGGAEAIATLVGAVPLQDCLQVASVEGDRCYLTGYSALSNTLETAGFPRGRRGSVVDRHVVVRNVCDAAVAVTSAVVGARGAPHFDVMIPHLPAVLEPGESRRVPIRYSPFEYWGDVGTLLVHSTSAPSPLRVGLCGAGAARPRMWPTPRSLDFGPVIYAPGSSPRSLCGSVSRSVRLQASGEGDVQVGAPVLDGDGDFEITGVVVDGQPRPTPSWPLVVPAGAALDLSLRLYPLRAAPAAHRATLRVPNDTVDEAAVVELVGLATDGDVLTETFEVPSAAKIDLLVVIDDSSSMADDHPRMLDNLDRLIVEADAQGADYQIAMILAEAPTMPDNLDPALLGPPMPGDTFGRFRRCLANPAILTPAFGQSAADPAAARRAAFRCLYDVEIQVQEPWNEAGLGATMLALRRATDPFPEPASRRNSGFVRPDARLVALVISDTDDRSLEWLGVVRDYLRSLEGPERPEAFELHYVGRRLAEAPRYQWIIEQLGGAGYPITDEDWTPMIEGLRLDEPEVVDRWRLGAAPDPTSIQVLVDGVEVPAHPVEGWAYDPAANTISFGASAPLGPGARVSVEYRPVCRP